MFQLRGAIENFWKIYNKYSENRAVFSQFSVHFYFLD